MAEIGIAMDGRAPIADIPAQARAAEEGGATHAVDRLPSLPARSGHDGGAGARRQRRSIKVALMAMSPYSMHPVYIAMAAASLDEMYPGRVILCLGAGAPADLKAAGIESPKPLVDDSARRSQICRQLFAGEMADFQGQMFQVAGPAPGQWRRARSRSCSPPRGPTC